MLVKLFTSTLPYLGTYLLELDDSEQIFSTLESAGRYNYHVVRNERTLSNFVYASHIGASNCTVRLRNIGGKSFFPFSKEILMYIFENYGLRDVDPITDLTYANSRNKVPSFYLLHFKSPEDASRAYVEKSTSSFRGIPLKLFWYRC